MAGKQVQRRRGSTSQHAVFTGAVGEVTVDTDKKVEVVHDGTTPGGFPQASARDIAATNANVTAAQTTANNALASANQAGVDAGHAQADATTAITKANTAQSEVDALETVVASNYATTVKQDAGGVSAAKVPKGTNVQRPTTPQPGDFRFNTDLGRFEGYSNSTVGWAPIGGDSIPLFTVFWVPMRTAVPAGFVAADGQLLSRATYPDAWAGINVGNAPGVSDANWLASPVYRGSYSIGDGTSTFRLPDLNGKASGSYGALFLRGDGLNSAGTDGLVQLSGNLQHTHVVSTDVNAGQQAASGNGGTTFNNANRLQYLGSDSTGNYPLFAANSGGNESRPLSVTGCWAVKLFGAVINPGAADAAQLASDLANLSSIVQNQCYKKNNILGTVSTSGGVPTGAILQNGANANGYFVRMADGTQICHTNGQQMVPAVGVSSMGWAFPIAFVTPPVGFSVYAAIGTGVDPRGYSAQMQYGGASTTTVTFDSYANSTVGFGASAIGRWN